MKLKTVLNQCNQYLINPFISTVGMVYDEWNKHGTEPKINVHGWFIWKYFATFWLIKTNSIEILVANSGKRRRDSKTADFFEKSFLLASTGFQSAMCFGFYWCKIFYCEKNLLFRIISIGFA